MKEIRIFGPPGTGKTTTLSRLVAECCQEFGSEAVLVASFTRAAARELVGRNLPLDEEQIGTLHALCYRALGHPKLITKAALGDWNAEHPTQSFGGIQQDLADPYGDSDRAGEQDGDRLLADLNRLRGLCQPPEEWPVQVQAFAERWQDFKTNTGLMDFTDLIETCLHEHVAIPHAARVLFLDEVQDFSPLELALARQWGENCERVYLAGDDDQCLYQFKGCTPDAFLYPELPVEQIQVLAQSYRLPRAIHAAAAAWAETIEARMAKPYHPRPAAGLVDYLPTVTYRWVTPLREHLTEWVGADKTVALLASCSYFLDPLKHALREWGIPFHNPWRRKRGDWNPLHGRDGDISAADRLKAFRKVVDSGGWWTYQDLWLWVAPLEAESFFTHGAKTAIRRQADETPDAPVNEHDLTAWMPDPTVSAAAGAGDLMWYEAHCLKTHVRAIQYGCRIVERAGMAALKDSPRVILGTIHCSPGDELILTTDGDIPIGQLNPDKHRLASYTDTCNRLLWGGRNSKREEHRKDMGYPFTIARRRYEGDMLTITTAVSRTRVTPTHRLQVRFMESFFNKWIVYLMRRGNWWRIGLCTSGNRPYKSGGLKGRMATEQADAGWILGVFNTAKEAAQEELKIQCEYGLPGLTFEACRSRAFRSEELHGIHESLRTIVEPRAAHLLWSRGLWAESPLFRRNNGPRVNQRGMFLTEAANLMSGYMALPVISDAFRIRERKYNCKPTWLPLSVSVEREWRGEVYSLDVKPYHHYISGRAVVHNSVKGGEADIVVLFPDLSPSGYQNWVTPGPTRDAVKRMWYVGMTRAKEALYFAAPFGPSLPVPVGAG